jgi:outer membrane lipoprotein-sorting protein
MKKIFTIVIVLFFVSSRLIAQELKLEEILANYYKTMGYEKLKNLKTIISTGSMTRQDIMPVRIIKMRPDKYRMEYEVQDVAALQVFDGQKAWWTTPWTGNSAPQVMPEDRTKDMKNRSDFEGNLYNWQAKGHSLELAGLEKMDSIQAYKLKLTRKDGVVEYYFIDAMKFLIHKQLSYRQMQGKDVAIEVYFKNYKNVDGIIFAFLTESFMGGQPLSVVEYETIELDKPVNEKIFDIPAK